MQNRFTTELLKSLSSMQDRKKSALITKEEYERLLVALLMRNRQIQRLITNIICYESLMCWFVVLFKK